MNKTKIELTPEINPKYKQHYNHRDNKTEQKKYKPETVTIRKFDPKTETYKYEKKIINHKLDWENTEEMYKNNLKEGRNE